MLTPPPPGKKEKAFSLVPNLEYTVSLNYSLYAYKNSTEQRLLRCK